MGADVTDTETTGLMEAIESLPRVGYQAVYGVPNSGWAIPERSVIAAVADSLDAAWAEAEAVMPEGWIGPEIAPYPDTPAWFSAIAFSRRHWEGEEDALVDGEGDTPAAALRELARKLREDPA